MLTKQDLLDIRDFLNIRGVMKEVIHEEVPPLVRAIVREEIDSLMEYQIMPQFESIQKQFDQVYLEFNKVHKEIAWIKNAMATKGFVEERLERFRVDLGLSYRAAS